MEHATTRKLTKLDILGALAFGIVWGVLTTLGITLSNRRQIGHWDSERNILGRFAVLVVVGALGTLVSRRIFRGHLKIFPGYLTQKASSPAQARVQTMAFILLMLGLAYAWWRLI